MKSQPKSVFPLWRYIRAGLAGLAVVSILSLSHQAAEAASDSDATADSSGDLTISVDGKALPKPASNAISIPSSTRSINVSLGYLKNSPFASRYRWKFDGLDERWREGTGGEMILGLRFFDSSGDKVDQISYVDSGMSAGWKGDLNRSAFTHRREKLVVPPKAASLWVILSSAGPPETLGVFTLEGLSVSRLKADRSTEVLIRSPRPRDLEANAPTSWVADGIRPSMAKLVQFGEGAQSEGLCIVDDDPNAHAEWRTTKDDAPAVLPGEQLIVEWNEVYSIGLGTRAGASYPAPEPGVRPLRVQRLDIDGNPVGAEYVLMVTMQTALWKRPWFWVAAAVLLSAALVSLTRYMVHRKMREELLILRQDRMVEQERLRIARDIHDDLSARATHISLLSARGEEESAGATKAHAIFEQISGVTRNLVFALHETIWAVNPENDNAEALVNHLCQIANELCESAALRCRLHVPPQLPDSPIASDVRHQITMTIREAIHNVVKHARAEELDLSFSFENSVLTIAVRDDGMGFEPVTVPQGNGLGNMRRRLEEIGGLVTIESVEGKGTTVVVEVRSKTAEGRNEGE